jgi:hypothetical protein
LNLGANRFTMMKINISLTLPAPTMISVLLPELWLHLHICNFGKVVILASYVKTRTP